MKRFNYITYLIGTIFAMVFSTSCRDLDLNPYDSISSGTMWTTENLADQGVMGIYNVLFKEDVTYDLYKYDSFGVTSDCRDQDYSVLLGNASNEDKLFSNYWKVHYEGVHRANDAIANLPQAPLSAEKMNRLIAEAKFLRAYYYYKLNIAYRGVPLYLEPKEFKELTQGRETEAKIWETIITDLTDCINEPNLPDRYKSGDANYGRITKSATYALRGKVYMWTKEWAKAEADFKKVEELGHKLFTGGYKELFKEANEQCDEMIFSRQCVGEAGYGNSFSFRYGTRVSYGSCWNTYLPNADFVDSYECIDGAKFDWDDYLPGYSQMTPKQRKVFFLRDNLTRTVGEVEGEYEQMEKGGADMSKYLNVGNEARLLKAYESRDPRLKASIITPYSTYIGANSGNSYTYTLRWPYRGYDTAEPFDIRTDTNNRFYYLFRKFVAEGVAEIPNREYSPIDIPLIRYADVLLSRAEAINEQGFKQEAVDLVNLVRARAGVAPLQTNDSSKPTYVNTKEDMRVRIQNERRWEFNGEGVNYFDEIRWETWKNKKFFQGAGLKQIWGESQHYNTWGGEHYYIWPIPKAECDMNSNLTQNEGWK